MFVPYPEPPNILSFEEIHSYFQKYGKIVRIGRSPSSSVCYVKFKKAATLPIYPSIGPCSGTIARVSAAEAKITKSMEIREASSFIT